MKIQRKDAEAALHKKYPELKIVETRIYKNSAYLFTAVDDPNETDYDDPFYMVGDDLVVRSYSPTDDFENFERARLISS